MTTLTTLLIIVLVGGYYGPVGGCGPGVVQDVLAGRGAALRQLLQLTLERHLTHAHTRAHSTSLVAKQNRSLDRGVGAALRPA